MSEVELPAWFKEARAADEPFWQTQEKRVQGSLGQPCCTLSGFSTSLMKMYGNFAVVLHGEDECAACFRHVGPSNHRFYCTRLEEEHFVTGETAEPLEECLTLVARDAKPDAIFVLGACPIEVIGDRFETVVARVNKRFPTIPMIPLHTSGLKVGSQAQMVDWLFSTLSALPPKAPADKRWTARAAVAADHLLRIEGATRADQHAAWLRVAALPAPKSLDPSRSLNLFGLPHRVLRGDSADESLKILAAGGLEMVASYPNAASFDDWRAIGFARATFVADRSLYPKLVKVLEAADQEVYEVPLPIGLGQTAEFYDVIGEAYGVAEVLRQAAAPYRRGAEEAVADFRGRYSGLRMALGVRMNNNYETDQLAYWGLGDLRCLQELGFEITVMVQGPPEKHDRFKGIFQRYGFDLPFEMFAEPWNLSEHLGRDRFDIAYLADHARGEARKAGVPMVVIRELDPWFSGVAPSLEHMSRTLRGFGLG